MKSVIFSSKRNTLLFLSITALGISSIMTQLTVMRELLTVISGNELIIGIILANWLFLTGFGAYLGKFTRKTRREFEILIAAQIFIALLPIAHILLIRVLRNVIFIRGEAIGMASAIISSFILLLPYCLISGFLLTFACTVFTSKDETLNIGQIYFIDNIGDILGGLIFSFILVYFLNVFQILYFPAALNLFCAILLSIYIGKRALAVALVICTSVAFFLFGKYDLNTITTAILFKGQNLVERRDSIYGNVVVTKIQDQYQFYENGFLLFFTDNVQSNEETVHYAMIQHPEPKNILLISGGVAGTTEEILKYNPDRIDYVELDPLIIKIGKKYTKSLENEKIHISNLDGRLFVKTTSRKYDVAILDLPPPDTAQVNRFYTYEFLTELKRVLKPDAVVSLPLLSSEHYRSQILRKLNSILFSSLKKVFENVIIIPGETNFFFIASDADLFFDIADKIEQRRIDTKYVNKLYLPPPPFLKDKIEILKSEIDPKAGLNRDFNPVSLFLSIEHWLSQFKFRLWLFLGIIAVFVLIYLARIRAIPFAIFTTGFAASALEVVILIGFQILYGYVYHKVGIIITMFMLGLAIGSFYMNRILQTRKIRDLIQVEFAIVAFAVVLPFILVKLNHVENKFFIFFSAHIIFPVLTIVLAILVGMEFPLSSKLFFKGVANTAGILYSADLIGACIGAIIVSTILIPLLGILKVCIFVAALNLVSGSILIFAYRK